MAVRRIAYGAALLFALLCQMFDVGYLVHFVFVLVVCLPFLGLALSLPAMLGCKARLSPQSPAVRRGEQAGWELVLKGRFALPLPRVSCRIRVSNRMTGEAWSFRVRKKGVVPGQRLCRRMEADRCGSLECQVERLWVCDCLGLFALPVRPPASASVLVCPVPIAPGPIALPEGGGRPVPVPRGKSASGEEYELRPYQPGDNIRAIHWKLSAKRDELVVREMLELHLPLIVLTFDHFGPPEKLERTLDQLAGLSDALLKRERPHEVRWAEPVSGAVRRREVSDRQSWMECLEAVLSDSAPEKGRSVLEQPLGNPTGTKLFHIHVTGEEERHGET